MKTEFVKVDPSDLYSCADIIDTAAKIIRRGGLVVFPTETVYGLGADGTSAEAASKIYAAKGRPSDNPLIIHISSPEEAELYTYTDKTYYELAKRFMPGPLTVVLKSKPIIPGETRASLPTVAVRCPEHPVARALIKAAGKPIAAPSANLSGSPSPTNAGHVFDDMNGRVDMIIDGGECEIGLESTIVKIEDDGSLVLLRPGRITPEELASVASLTIADAVVDKLREGETVLSPGMKYRHYAPKAPLMLIDGDTRHAISYLRDKSDCRMAVISYKEDEALYREAFPESKIFVLGSRDDEAEQAHALFSLLREADKLELDAIYAPLPEKRGMGLALYNRMIRAAAHTIIKL